MNYDNQRVALNKLNTAAQNVLAIRSNLERLSAQYDAARDEFDALHDEVLKFLPELATGFDKHETVALVDGKIRVVPDV